MAYSIASRSLLKLAFLGLGLAGCKKEIDTYYTEVGTQIPTVLSNALPTTTKYATGETFSFELQYAQQTSPLTDVRIYQRIEPNTDSTLVQTIPYKAAFSKRKNADTLVVNYTVPAGVNKANVRVAAIVRAENGQVKQRAFYFRLAEATPTVAINSSANVTAPGNTTPVPGDIINYVLTLNAGGITSASSLTTAGTLYKDLDSLITYVKVGTAAERRYIRQRVPASGTQTGAATALTVPVTIPAGSGGQAVTFRFEAKTNYLGTPRSRTGSATSAAITPGTPTSLAAARTATLTYTGTTGGDLAAYDLVGFAAVPAASAVDTKDVAITSTASNAVQLKALNTTKFVKSAAAVYSSATLNSIRQTYLTAATTNQLSTLDAVVVGDVYVARLRNADQYAIFTVTGINRTATAVTLTMDIKAL
ncbi:hypothetical protein [Hymenobacter cavernae]|uniref:DUF4466 domain-containing protein n=1 Tax=Hymenobacter cavernae TaxID=2044852 RepID=A0ABQ1TGV7_9BACT|nr:hypothetical protein [Hymenobacter cavernae]GGE93762.1 hypothetical protein GCM10011383_00580 [Hymenobacter cavernae]